MHIYVTQALAHKVILFDKAHHFLMLSEVRRGKCSEERKYLRSALKVAAGEFADDERMTDNLSVIQQCFKFNIALPEVFYPHRSIYEDHVTFQSLVCGV